MQAHVSVDSPFVWEIGGESTLHADTRPAPGDANGRTLIRITHSNVYGPVDFISLYVRVGDSTRPTAFDDLDSSDDWLEMQLVAQSLFIDENEIDRSEAGEAYNPMEETPWRGTFEAMLDLLPGRHSIEIKVLSSNEIMQSGVISDWHVALAE